MQVFLLFWCELVEIVSSATDALVAVFDRTIVPLRLFARFWSSAASSV